MAKKISSNLHIVESAELNRAVAKEIDNNEEKNLEELLNDEHTNSENNTGSM